jgi:hypothetical protein
VLVVFVAGVAVGLAAGACATRGSSASSAACVAKSPASRLPPAPHGAIPGPVSSTGQPPFGIG